LTKSADRPATSEEQVSVQLLLNWFPEAEHGGYYAALVHGEFAKEGLDVTIVPGGPKAPVISQVASGGAVFGVDNADKLLLGRAQEADVVAVFAPIQTSPRCILVHEESGIKTFDDLAAAKNFTLAMNPGQPFAQFLNKKYPMEGVQKVPYPGNLSQFLLDKRFGQQAYSFSEPFAARQAGAQTRNLMLADIGFNSYTSLLVVSRDTLTKQPELVRKIVAASSRGWERYLKNAAETNAHIHKENPEMSPEILAFGVEALQPLCTMNDNAPFGSMTEARWSDLITQMTDAGSLTGAELDAKAAFTNDALPARSANDASLPPK
jgi:NitT/TauT family transport system substrate-binding protein